MIRKFCDRCGQAIEGNSNYPELTYTYRDNRYTDEEKSQDLCEVCKTKIIGYIEMRGFGYDPTRSD